MKPLIVVVGATGQQGGSVINALINSRKWTVCGLSRNILSKDSQVRNDEELLVVFFIEFNFRN
jgi:hypothetical protein